MKIQNNYINDYLLILIMVLDIIIILNYDYNIRIERMKYVYYSNFTILFTRYFIKIYFKI